MKSVMLLGVPNAGKSTLFNALSGGRARVGNYPGVTVERLARTWRIPNGPEVELVDLPGTYSLAASSPDEAVAVACLLDDAHPPDLVIAVVDATALSRSLYLVHQLREAQLPMVVALNMMDVAERTGVTIDATALSERLGVPCVGISALRSEGLAALAQQVLSAHAGSASLEFMTEYPERVERAIEALAPAVREWRPKATAARRRVWALWSLLSLGDDELEVPPALRDATEAARAESGVTASTLDRDIVSTRYARVDDDLSAVSGVQPASMVSDGATPQGRATSGAPDARSATERIDAILLHGVWGTLAFTLVMYMVFEALFSWSDPMIGAIETLVSMMQGWVRAAGPEGALRDLVENGIIAGVGNVVVFVPQVALLFLMIGFLEDSGYLARAAFLIDRIMSKAGLSGKAFVPLLSGCACAVPAVMATRTIASRRDRIATMLALPLMTCSARLPVFVLIISTVFVGSARVAGVFSLGAVLLFGLYALAVVSTLVAAAVLRRTALKGPRSTMVLELPPYRWPVWRTLLWTTWLRVRSFLVDAGTIILAMSIVLWAMLTYPHDDAVAARFEGERAAVRTLALDEEARAARIAELEEREAGEQLRRSFAGRMGLALEPVIEPLGFDWRIGVGIIGSFAAREVFVSTMATVFGIEATDEPAGPIREELASATWPDGRTLMTPLAGVSLLIFFVFACQCISTLAVVWRESGSWRWAFLLFAYMSVLAYGSSFLVFQIGSALGWGTA